MDAQLIINGLAADITELRSRLETVTAQRDAALEQVRQQIPPAPTEPVKAARARKATKRR